MRFCGTPFRITDKKNKQIQRTSFNASKTLISISTSAASSVAGSSSVATTSSGSSSAILLFFSFNSNLCTYIKNWFGFDSHTTFEIIALSQQGQGPRMRRLAKHPLRTVEGSVWSVDPRSSKTVRDRLCAVIRDSSEGKSLSILYTTKCTLIRLNFYKRTC